MIKTDSNGNKLWDKTFGESGFDAFFSIQQTSDGGYIAAGTTESHDPLGGGAWLIKTDSNGNKLWDKTFGGDCANSVKQTSDGGYITAGSIAYCTRERDAWLIKTDANGNEVMPN
jgi:hypothetical protein